MKVGFTGSRNGMTLLQRELFIKLLTDTNIDTKILIDEFHVGDCVGSDTDAFNLIKEHVSGCKTFGHIPSNKSMRSYLHYDVTEKPIDYLKRNQHIVNACDVLIATPEGAETLRSGTWATIRYARKIGKKVIIL